MLRSHFSTFLPAVLFFAASVFGQTTDMPRQQLAGHLTSDMLNSRVTRPVPPNTPMSLSVGLLLSKQDELLKAAEQVSDPSSPSYRKYMTPEQVADAFGASPSDYQALLDWGQSNHFSITPHRNRFVATFDGAAADVEKALNVHMNYRQRADGSEFFAPDTEPSVQLAVPVAHISGLENFVLPSSAGGSGAGGGYQGADFRNAYAPGMTMRGGGQKIGIFADQGFAQSDIDSYGTLTNQSFLPVQVVPANSQLGTPQVEPTLDIEMALSMAPTSQVVFFFNGNNDCSAILANMSDRPDVKQLSSSLFWYYYTNTDTAVMAAMAMQGQSFFQASGDNGAYQVIAFPFYVSGNLDIRQLPYITVVGGTSLNMSNYGASYGTLETAWTSSSGGIVASVAIPSYQAGIAGHNGASSTDRNEPDVSAQAAQGNIFLQGSVQSSGTSQATPLWAGFMALVNELASSGGQPTVGFANPAMYKIAASSAYHNNFHDVVSGCAPSTLPNTINTYCAGSGYDLVGGLGSPQHSLTYSLSGVTAYPLYCRGPLSTSNNSTPFKWASQGAGAQAPGPGQCAWADGPPQGTEIKSGGNVISGDIGSLANLPAGKYFEVGVFNNGSKLVATQVVGIVNPPFSSSVALP